jgi:hypothetical protein
MGKEPMKCPALPSWWENKRIFQKLPIYPKQWRILGHVYAAHGVNVWGLGHVLEQQHVTCSGYQSTGEFDKGGTMAQICLHTQTGDTYWVGWGSSALLIRGYMELYEMFQECGRVHQQ